MVSLLCSLILTDSLSDPLFVQTDADRKFLAAKGSVPIGIGKNSHIKRAIIDKNARIGDNVKVKFLELSCFKHAVDAMVFLNIMCSDSLH